MEKLIDSRRHCLLTGLAKTGPMEAPIRQEILRTEKSGRDWGQARLIFAYVQWACIHTLLRRVFYFFFSSSG